MSWVKKNITVEVADYLFNIKVSSLPDRIGVFQKDVKDDLAIDYDTLEDQMMEMPEVIAFWDMILASQKAKVASIETSMESLKGQIVRRLVEQGRQEKVDIRRSDLDDMVNADEEMMAKKASFIMESRNEDKLKAVVNGLRIKADMLRSLAGFKREEKKEE